MIASTLAFSLLFRLQASRPEVGIVGVEIKNGAFVIAKLKVGPGERLKFKNLDSQSYIIESPGLFPGDMELLPGTEQVVKPLSNPGKFHVLIEESPASDLEIEYSGSPRDPNEVRRIPFDVAKDDDRQPILFEPGDEPEFATFLAFNFNFSGEDSRQRLLREFYLLQESLASLNPPADLPLPKSARSWSQVVLNLRINIALGPGAYDAKRFGDAVALSRPKGLVALPFEKLKLKDSSAQRDVLVRITSDDESTNRAISSWIQRKLAKQISGVTQTQGASPKGGRSPLLGGFFDGIGNPGGLSLQQTVFGEGNGTTLTVLQIGFDQKRFLAHSESEQQALIGREKQSGKPYSLDGKPTHRSLSQNDRTSTICRQPFILARKGQEPALLFCSVQASLEPFRRILFDYMLPSKDPLLDYMHFESAAVYAIPASPKGSYPGSLRVSN